MRSPKATVKNSPHSPQLEKVRAQGLSPSIAKNNFFKLKKKKESSIDNLPLRLQESPYLGFGFQIFLPKELSFFLTANFEFKEGAGTFILPENWIIMCFIKRNAGLHCRLREVCRGHLFWQGSTFLPLMGLVLLDSQIKGSAHSHSKIYSLMGCNSHYVPLITLGKQ